MDTIKKRYLNPRIPGGLSGASAFIRNSKYKDSKKVLKVLQELKTYNLHKPVRLRFKRRPLLCSHIDNIWGMDIIVYPQFKRANSGFAYLLLAVDCFSKALFLEKLKTRKASDIVKALEAILKRSGRKPEKIGADKETGFRSSLVSDFLKKHDIVMYHPVSYLHSSLAERYVLRVKRIFARLFTHQGNHKWLGSEQDVESQINNSYNKSIKMRSVDVTKANESEVWYNLYSQYIGKTAKAKYKPGDLVKISTRTLKDVFKKAYDVSWTIETFKVRDVKTIGSVVYYTLEDLEGEKLEGTYYEQELQPVSRPENSDE
jgi:hypothetical protein